MGASQLMHSIKEISHSTAVEWLMNWQKRQFLEPFVREPMSVPKAAEVIDVTPNRLYYYAKKFIELGLLEVAGSATLEGHKVEVYQPTAEQFFVPFALLSYPVRNKMLKHVTAVKEFSTYVSNLPEAQSDLWGALITVGPSDKGIPFELELVPADLRSVYAREPWKISESPTLVMSAILSSEILIRLDDGAAKAFQQELAALTQRFKQLQSVSGKPYHVALAMTPGAGR